MNDKDIRSTLKDNLMKLAPYQLKLFFGMLVHYWAEYKYFITSQSFFNLWCELNLLCSEADESFPSPFDDRELLKSYCHAHPYYFIDILCPEIVADLFCEHLNDRMDTLAMIANKLATEGLRAAYESSNKALGLSENVDELVAQSKEHIEIFS